MRAFVIFATLTVAVLARPDVSHLAQQQQQPSGYQYGGNANTNGNGNGGDLGYNGGGSSNDLGEGFEESSIFKGFSSYDAPLVSGSNIDNGANAAQNIDVRLQGDYASSGASAYSGSSGNDINLVQGQSKSIDLTGGNAGGKRIVYKPVIKQGEPIITKNFYVHAAPEEDEDVQIEEKIQIVRPQKSYKIIFIKAPSAGAAFNPANYPIYPQNEEKTIVYVLSKKEDQISDFAEIPQPPAAVTHKPEVFFIKYKTKQEAAEAVANIQNRFQEEANNNNFEPSSISQEYNGDEIPEAAPTDAAFLPTDTSSYGANDIGSTAATGYDTNVQASQASFGANGGQVNVQGGNYGPQQTASFVPNGQQYSALNQDSNGGSSSFVPQVLRRINDEDRKNYLPPNYRL